MSPSVKYTLISMWHELIMIKFPTMQSLTYPRSHVYVNNKCTVVGLKVRYKNS